MDGSAATRRISDRVALTTLAGEAMPAALPIDPHLEGIVRFVDERRALVLIAPPGAGKTTLCRMLTGQDEPDSGALRIGETVEMSYVDQSRDALDGSKTVWEEISDGLDVIELGKATVQSRAYVGGFNFRGPDQQKPVGQLSGGEQQMLAISRALLATLYGVAFGAGRDQPGGVPRGHRHARERGHRSRPGDHPPLSPHTI